MISLSPEHCRVIGVMLEKETTTPDQYPLSLNSLVSGCNQKSNREPVMSLAETAVQNLVDELVQMNQLMIDHKASGRVNKYFHRFCNTEFGRLQFSSHQRAIICMLLLRGPQTPGELRTRTNRLADFTSVSEVEDVLISLQDLSGQTFVQKLAREPGKRESRYVHLFSDVDDILAVQVNHDNKQAQETFKGEVQEDMLQRVTRLEQQVADLTEEVALLTLMLEDKS